MGSCVSKNILKEIQSLGQRHSIRNAKVLGEEQKRAVSIDKQEKSELESSLSLDTCFITQDSLNEEDKKERLYELVYNRQWYDAIELMKKSSNPRIADYVDMHQRTCLHWAVIKKAPRDFVKSVLKLNSDATMVKDYTGRTPIHLALEHASDDVVKLLLDSTDASVYVWRDFKNTRCLLSEAIFHDRSCNIINAILEADINQIDLIDCHGNTPLVLFFRKNLGKMLFISNTCGVFKSHMNVDDMVEIASILLRAEFSTSTGRKPTQNDSVLCMSIANESTPSQFVQLLIQEYPEQTKIQRNGNYPIHVACMCNDHSMECYKCDCCFNSNTHNRVIFFHRGGVARVLCNACITEVEKEFYIPVTFGERNTNIIDLLLISSENDSEKKNSKNKLPLHLAISSGRHWFAGGIKNLVEANPRALKYPDPSTGLLPFALAASQSQAHDGDSIAQLETIYELLLRLPSV